MHHWDRDTSGRLQRISAPVEQGCEVSVHSDQMDPLPEEQQSQQGTPMNSTVYRSAGCSFLHHTSCCGCSSETLLGSPTPHISWYGK